MGWFFDGDVNFCEASPVGPRKKSTLTTVSGGKLFLTENMCRWPCGAFCDKQDCAALVCPHTEGCRRLEFKMRNSGADEGQAR